MRVECFSGNFMSFKALMAVRNCDKLEWAFFLMLIGWMVDLLLRKGRLFELGRVEWVRQLVWLLFLMGCCFLGLGVEKLRRIGELS